jgi:chemotaxis protein histidine kinase CheA
MPQPPDALQAQLRELKRVYARSLPEKIAKVESAFRSYFAAAWDETACGSTYRIIHSLAGSSGTYGFAELCQVARSAENILKESMEAHRLPSPERQQEALAHVDRLKELASAAAASEGH